MSTLLDRARTTSPSPTAAAVRVLAGSIFLASGTLKAVTPKGYDNWRAMVTQIHIPLGDAVAVIAPAIEITLGLLLLTGLLGRLAGAGGLAMMAGAAYIHLTVDPHTLPIGLPPTALPIVTAAASAYVAWRGAGRWSIDLAHRARQHPSVAAQVQRDRA